MKALVVIDIDDNHLHRESMNLYDKLAGYKCKLIPVPEYNPDKNGYFDECENAFMEGYMACVRDIKEVMGED